MVLSTKCACWNQCQGDEHSSKGGLTSGGVFLIVLVVLIFIYVITMISLNKWRRKATGVDLLPHRTFWITVPGLAREGFRFTFYKITRKSEYHPIE